MFYSHTFLARKGPLGTVWCAAHLQHRLKKSHYVTTNVPSTVERIMFPEVPIALRMSGHLLLGVVRIYSKQVDYLYEDCNEIRITINRVFTAVNVNLPVDANHAPFHLVTLPEKLNLDSLELDDYNKDWGEDIHLKSHNDITLTEQIPTGKDPYIIITIDEHDLRSSPFIEDNSVPRPTPMDEDVAPVELNTDAGLKDLSPSKQSRVDDRNVGTSSPQNLHSIEIMRDAAHGFDFNNSPILPDRAAPDKFLEEQIIREKETFTPATEEMVLPDGHFSSSHNHEEQHSLGPLNSPTPFVIRSPEMEIQPSPIAKPKINRKKRKQLYDESTVLRNVVMRNSLDDTMNIRRVRKECPSSPLAIWKHNNALRLRKEGVIFEPFLTGACADLQAIFKHDLVISANFQLSNTKETHQETNADRPSSSRLDNNIEIEILRNNECASPERNISSFSTVVPSPVGRSCFTPENRDLGLQSEKHLETTEGGPTADVGPSGNFDSEMRTPDTFYEKGFQDEHTALSDIPELVASLGELGFLEQDDNSPAGFDRTPGIGIASNNQGTPELQALSSRTRAVAQYLQKQSSVTPILENTEESSDDLRLNKILEGKPRKICARMFFETLVLKSHGLVDVNQEKAYDDITLKVTPKLSKGKFSG